MRSLWQILVAFKDRNQSAGLTCDESFRYMEHIVEEATPVISHERARKMLEAVQAHHSICPDCREHHFRRLKSMEMNIKEEQNPKRKVVSD